MLIEWIHHLFSADTQRYPWHPNAVYIPEPQALDPDPLRAYINYLDTQQIDRAILVHPEPYGDDHSLVLDALTREPNRFRATCLFYPKDPDAPRKLVDLVAREPRIIALRFHAHRGKEQYLDSFQDAGVRKLWQQAAELNLMIELHIGPNYAEQARELIAAYPNTPVIIDHLGEPQFGYIPEFANMLALAELPNTLMKLSCYEYIAVDEPLYLSAQRFTQQLAVAFGPARLVWGGIVPALVAAHLPNYSAADHANILGGNLQRLLGWP